jgi:ATP-dependent exoDNAse (exonuclease V) alpha subunit
MQGVVKDVDPRKCRMDFMSDDGREFTGVRFDPDTFGKEKPNIDRDPKAPHPFDWAYCITCRKAQGSEWPSVLVIEQKLPDGDLHRWAYTAASRAKKRLIWVAT